MASLFSTAQHETHAHEFEIVGEDRPNPYAQCACGDVAGVVRMTVRAAGDEFFGYSREWTGLALETGHHVATRGHCLMCHRQMDEAHTGGSAAPALDDVLQHLRTRHAVITEAGQ